MFWTTRTIERFRPIIYFEQPTERNFSQTFEFLRDISYDAFWHVADPFNRNNLRDHSHNIFGRTREVMVLALPREKRDGLEKSGFALDEISQPIYDPRAILRPIQAGRFRKLPTEIFLQLISSGSRIFWKKFNSPCRNQ